MFINKIIIDKTMRGTRVQKSRKSVRKEQQVGVRGIPLGIRRQIEAGSILP
jgi:hypothetical protein